MALVVQHAKHKNSHPQAYQATLLSHHLHSRLHHHTPNITYCNNTKQHKTKGIGALQDSSITGPFTCTAVGLFRLPPCANSNLVKSCLILICHGPLPEPESLRASTTAATAAMSAARKERKDENTTRSQDDKNKTKIAPPGDRTLGSSVGEQRI
jgi:hypothetical protein